MNPRTLAALAAISALVLAFAWWRSGGASDGTLPGAGDAFLPGFAEAINDVVRIEVDDGESPSAFERRDGRWVDPARGGYPVKFDEVKRMLIGLQGLEKAEAKTARRERHAELQLALEGDEDARGKSVRLWVAGREEPAFSFVIGQTKWSPVRGAYARLADEDQCWFVTGEISLPYQATAWLDKEVANVNQLDVERIALVRGPEAYTISRADDAAPWSLAELPDGRKLKEFAPFGSLANVLGYLNFDDVAAAGDERFQRGPDEVAEYRFFNGATVRLECWRDGEGDKPAVWARLASTPPTAEAPPPPPDGEADGPQEGPRGPSAETLRGWESKWQGWIYKLPEWKGSALRQGLDDWLEPLPEPEPESTEPADAPQDDPPPPVEDDGDGR